ncbi:MAG TPA: FAD/NAD(P)-binding protein [Methylocella sp.]|jgi:uncharacterized NAD(P)/FAD-binding protein YdhS
MVSIGIIGGGFSGGILALHLLQHGVKSDDIFVIDDRPSIGLGQAYSATAPWHLLNIRASGMSPLLDRPDAFVNFLDKQTDLPPEPGVPLGERFVPRLFYGRFLLDLIETAKSQGRGRPRLTHLRGRAVAVKRNAAIPHGYEILLKDGRSLPASQVVLALGNLAPSKPKGIPPWFVETDRYIGDPWNPGAISAIGQDDRVLLIGTGLTTVDSILSLAAQDHLGPMIAISRHGLLPRSHSDIGGQFWPSFANPSAPKPVRELLIRVRDQVKAAAAAGVSWQAVINLLRPTTQDLWRELPEAEKARFIRHIRPWWDVHRHRLAPGKWQEIQKLIASEQLIVKAGRIEGYHQAGDKIEAVFRSRSQTGSVRFGFDALINCMGPNYDFAASDQPLLRQMVESGLMRPNQHRLGLDVDMARAVVDGEGRVFGNLYAMGPMLRGQFWEINAVPEIAKQARDLAGLLAGPRLSGAVGRSG